MLPKPLGPCGSAATVVYLLSLLSACGGGTGGGSGGAVDNPDNDPPVQPPTSATAIYSFLGTSPSGPQDGRVPHTQLLLGADGNLYGTTHGGGYSNAGTIFRITMAGEETVLHSFGLAEGGPGEDGAYPRAELAHGNDGYLYGTTGLGGEDGSGTIFRIHPTSGEYTTLYSFLGYTAGADPSGLTLAPDGTFFATTYYWKGEPGGCGSSGCGAIVRFDPASNAVTAIHVLANDGSEGQAPTGGVVLASNGLLYGTTKGGGAHQEGTVFSYDPATDHFTTLHHFSGADGSRPRARLVQLGDDLYGTTSLYAAIFRVRLGTGEVSVIADLGGDYGVQPDGGLTPGPDGLLYGTAVWGGANGSGTVYRCDPASGEITVLHAFSTVPVQDYHNAEGGYPRAPPTFTSEGRLFGTASIGGSRGDGTVFEVDLDQF